MALLGLQPRWTASLIKVCKRGLRHYVCSNFHLSAEGHLGVQDDHGEENKEPDWEELNRDLGGI